jgi:hypothetical protein
MDDQTAPESKTALVEKIKSCLRSGDYSRAVDLLRDAAEFRNAAELSGLEKLAHNGVRRNAEANRLITQSQELFAQQKAGEAIQLLREAYGLDKNNSLARAILANALMEQAQLVVENDWLEAETLTKQALDLNPAHPMAKTIRSLIVDRKSTSSIEDWVSRGRKLHSSGDLFAALAWVAEGLAVHPDDPRLLQIQEAIQSDQGARLRQTRRRDLEDLRRMGLEIDAAADVAAKQALGDRIQAVTAKYWTDGEILAVANGLLHRMGLVPRSSPSSEGKTGAVIFHVPRPSTQEPSRADTGHIPESKALASAAPAEVVPTATVPATETPVRKAPPTIEPTVEAPSIQATQLPTPAATVAAAEAPAPAAKVTFPLSRPQQPARSNSAILIFVSCAAIILVAATFFLTKEHYAQQAVKTSLATPAVSAAAISIPTAPTAAVSAPVVATPTVSDAAASTSHIPKTAESAPAVSKPAVAAPLQAAPERSSPALRTSSSDGGSQKITVDYRRPVDSTPNVGTLLIVASEDNARVSLNGQLQGQLTQAGQLRLSNLAPGDYVAEVSKSGFQDPPAQKVHIGKGEQASLIFTLQPPPRPASLIIQGASPGTAVFVDQNLVGSIPTDGKLSVSTINPGDHIVELSKEGFRPRQFKKNFVAGGAISLAAADTALEVGPAELKITFAPADAKVALVKGQFLATVSSGVPLSLAAGTYTLSARTADKFTRWSKLDVVAGQSKKLDLSLAPSGMSQWDDPGAWQHESDSFIRKGGNFVLYGVVPATGTFAFSAMITKGRLLQWVLNYTDPKNYVLCQMDNDNFYRAVIRNGEKTNEVKVREKNDKKSFRTLHVQVSPTEIVHMIEHGDGWSIVDRWTQPGTNLSLGKFGFYIPGDDQIALSSFAHYADLNIR